MRPSSPRRLIEITLPANNRSATCAGPFRDVFGVDVGVHDDLSIEHCHAGPGVARQRLRKEFSQLVEARSAAADIEQAVVPDERDADRLAREKPLAALQDDVENGLRIGNRAADGGKHFTGGALLIERFLRFVEQAYILERDRRLVAEGRE